MLIFLSNCEKYSKKYLLKEKGIILLIKLFCMWLTRLFLFFWCKYVRRFLIKLKIESNGYPLLQNNSVTNSIFFLSIAR